MEYKSHSEVESSSSEKRIDARGKMLAGTFDSWAEKPEKSGDRRARKKIVKALEKDLGHFEKDDASKIIKESISPFKNLLLGVEPEEIEGIKIKQLTATNPRDSKIQIQVGSCETQDQERYWYAREVKGELLVSESKLNEETGETSFSLHFPDLEEADPNITELENTPYASSKTFELLANVVRTNRSKH